MLVSEMRTALVAKVDAATKPAAKQKAQAKLDAFEEEVVDMEDDDEYEGDEATETPKVDEKKSTTDGEFTFQAKEKDAPTKYKEIDLATHKGEKKFFKCYIRMVKGELTPIMDRPCQGGVTLKQFAAKKGLQVSELKEDMSATFKGTLMPGEAWYKNGGDEKSRLNLKLGEITVIKKEHYRVLSADKGLSAEIQGAAEEDAEMARAYGITVDAWLNIKSLNAMREKQGDAAAKAAMRAGSDQ